MKADALTDIGRVRQMNQDALYASTEPVGPLSNLFLVADGMGGHRAGDFASRYLVEHLPEYIKESTETGAVAALRAAIDRINGELFELASSREELSGMGTTLVAATVEGDTLYAANIGDSRLYLIEKGGIRQVTKDHSFVEEMVSIGQMERESKEYKQQKNIITRAVGIEKKVEADFFEVGLKQGDYLLLCSDGLSNMVDNSSLFRLVLFPGTLHMKAKSLVALANQNGGKDNIAVVLVEPEVSEVRRA